MLCFYTGDFETVRRVSINPQGSLGWSTSFIQYGLRAILLYLYESIKMTEACIRDSRIFTISSLYKEES